MSDIVQFLRDRLDEDQAAADGAEADDAARRWTAWDDQLGHGVRDGNGNDVVYPDGTHTPEESRHIARQDPARTLRQVAAHRAILDLHQPREAVVHRGDMWAEPEQCCTECSPGRLALELMEGYEVVEWPCPTVRLLASAWSDHPDYDQSWAVREATGEADRG